MSDLLADTAVATPARPDIYRQRTETVAITAQRPLSL